MEDGEDPTNYLKCYKMLILNFLGEPCPGLNKGRVISCTLGMTLSLAQFFLGFIELFFQKRITLNLRACCLGTKMLQLPLTKTLKLSPLYKGWRIPELNNDKQWCQNNFIFFFFQIFKKKLKLFLIFNLLLKTRIIKTHLKGTIDNFYVHKNTKNEMLFNCFILLLESSIHKV